MSAHGSTLDGSTLAGRRILLTRAADDSAAWAARLRLHGAVPVLLPCVRSERFDDPESETTFRAALEHAAWMVFTSRQGVTAAAQLLNGRWPSTLRFAAVGPATARAVLDAFSAPALIARTATSAGIGTELVALIRGASALEHTRVVVVGAAAGRDDAVLALTRAGVPVTRIAVYRTIPAPPREPRLDLATLTVDQVWLASPSAVTGLRNQAAWPADTHIISIGPTTSAAARTAGLTVCAEAHAPTLLGMLQAAG